MKWRTKRQSYLWYTGPNDGLLVHYAKKGGKTYAVQAQWTDTIRRKGPVIWWSHDGHGTNKVWLTLDAAKAWCEQDSIATPEAPR